MKQQTRSFSASTDSAAILSGRGLGCGLGRGLGRGHGRGLGRGI